jgi:hypothetical protein
VRTTITALLLFALATPSALAAKTKERESDSGHRVENPLLGYTHMLPSPFTIPAGRLAIGTTVALGVTDFLQLSTDILRDFYKFYNASAKLAILDYPEFAGALTLGYESFNLRDVDSANPDISVQSWNPGGVISYEVMPGLAHAIGGNLYLTETEVNRPGLRTSGYMRGFTIENDLSWAYNPKRNGVGNVLSAGLTYDFTYKIYGIGISHHWPGFHAGIHYYPEATKYRIQPILVGGAVVDL